MIRTKKAGLLTKVVVLALLIYMATALLNLQGQIQEAQAQRDTLSQQVAEQTQINAELAEDVANPDDPDRISWALWRPERKSLSSPTRACLKWIIRPNAGSFVPRPGADFPGGPLGPRRGNACRGAKCFGAGHTVHIQTSPKEIRANIQGGFWEQYGVWCRFYCRRKSDRHHKIRRFCVTARRTLGSGAHL